MQQPGTLLEGKYEILGKIREGGMGSIYRVRHRLLDEIRVVKVLRPQVVEDPEMKRRFLDEAKTAMRLKHPSICAHYDFALDDDGTAYLVMEYIEGVNLNELLKSRGRPGLPLTLEIAHQALLALAYLHRRGVIHRDVAPDNLMLTRDEEGRPHIKLIDLGIAKALDRPGEATATGVFLGKLKYASPEQYGKLAAGEKLDGRSDLYSLSIVLYELLTGARPFAGETPAELLHAHIFSPPLPFSESDPEGKVPPPVREVILKGLEKKREDRYASAEDFDREILVLRDQFVHSEDLEGTQSILTSLSADDASSGGGVTPSAQGRLDRQFGAQTTPRPGSSGLKLAPTAQDRTSAPGPPARTGRPPEELLDTKPFPPVGHRRRDVLRWVIVAAVAIVLPLLWRSGIGRPAKQPAEFAESPAPLPTTPPSVPTAAAEPTALPAAVPTEEPAAQPTAPQPTPPPASAPRPDPELRQALDRSRTATQRARQGAEQARAADTAPDAWTRARRQEAEADRLAASGALPAAVASFARAATLYENAQETARTVQRPTAPAPPTPAPAIAKPAAEPTRIAAAEAAPTHLPVPPPAAAPARTTPTDADQIRETVHRYEQAQNTLDAVLYSRIFPSVDRQRIAQAFETLRSQTVEFEVRRIQVDPGGTRAEVQGFEKRVAVPRAGSELRSSGERAIHLEKRGDAWLIVGFD